MRRSSELFPVRREQDWGVFPWSETVLFGPSSFVNTSPWQTVRRVQEDMDSLFSQLLAQPEGSDGQNAQAAASGLTQRWAPSVDVSHNDQEWLIEADLPGVSQENLDVFVQNRHLVIRAELKQQTPSDEGVQRQYQRRERRYGFFERVFPLPQNVDEAGIRCDLRDGVLTVRVPRTVDQRSQVRRIPIGADGKASAVAEAISAEQSGVNGTHREPELAGSKNAGAK